MHIWKWMIWAERKKKQILWTWLRVVIKGDVVISLFFCVFVYRKINKKKRCMTCKLSRKHCVNRARVCSDLVPYQFDQKAYNVREYFFRGILLFLFTIAVPRTHIVHNHDESFTEFCVLFFFWQMATFRFHFMITKSMLESIISFRLIFFANLLLLDLCIFFLFLAIRPKSHR